MPGFELINNEEQKAVNSIFKNGGVLFAHGFEKIRKNFHVREFEKKTINIEQLARAIATTSTISKPTLRLILDNALHKKFLRFDKSKKDLRSVNIILEDLTIKEFKEWCVERSKWFNISKNFQ